MKVFCKDCRYFDGAACLHDSNLEDGPAGRHYYLIKTIDALNRHNDCGMFRPTWMKRLVGWFRRTA